MTAPLAIAPRRGAPGHRSRRRVARAALAAILVLLLLLAAGWLLWDNRRLDVTGYDVTVASLPASSEGLRIVQISDLHAADFGTFQDRVLADTGAARPDLIVLTGDLIDHRTADLSGVLELAARLASIAPTYLVLGNHEADSPRQDELLAGLEDHGVGVLRDEAVQVRIAGFDLTLIGLDDPRVRAAAGLPSRDPSSLLASLAPPDEETTILLAHRPELFDSYTGAGIDLVLSGHAHGGQVRLPIVGGLYAPHQGWLPELSEGVHERGDTTMVISRGLGNSIAGVRVNDPRELVVVELHSAE
ncbi:MAG: metallophosphoesterase [Brachybacterium sp.]|nr:metallophosphoesterase [Brachybacterium sp.]